MHKQFVLIFSMKHFDVVQGSSRIYNYDESLRSTFSNQKFNIEQNRFFGHFRNHWFFFKKSELRNFQWVNDINYLVNEILIIIFLNIAMNLGRKSISSVHLKFINNSFLRISIKMSKTFRPEFLTVENFLKFWVFVTCEFRCLR